MKSVPNTSSSTNLTIYFSYLSPVNLKDLILFSIYNFLLCGNRNTFKIQFITDVFFWNDDVWDMFKT